MKTIRSGMGLGDALYLQAVARHLVAYGQSLKVCCEWPDVFKPLIATGKVQMAPFTRVGIDILAHYSKRKANEGTTQFEDCCLEAGIKEPVELKLDWPASASTLADRLQGRPALPVVCVQLPRTPMGRTDGFGAELLPNCAAIQVAIDALRGRALIVQIGAGKSLYSFNHIDLNLANETTVSELLDVASVADAFIGYPSYTIPLAESFDKPALFVWSRRGTKAMHAYVRQITPQKILHKPSSRFVFDDATEQEITEAAHALLD